jgi:hypothetical protein
VANLKVANEASTDEHWKDDVLSRKKYAKFLTQLISSRCAPLAADSPARAFTMALDADWGAGKSFFVGCWSKDLARTQPVVLFDAWKSDNATDPMVALISEINKQLEPLVARLPVADKIKQSTGNAWSIAKRAGRKLALPAAKIAASTLLKQVSGLSLSDFTGDKGQASGDLDTEAAEESADVPLDQFAEKLGEALEKEYESRQHSIALFREKLASVVSSLNEHAVVVGPLVVFVDELDRCRPDFAIRLLETVKHVFDVPNVCFVLSINSSQLSESIRSIYGENFDAQHYLHRFFDLTYQLPEPDHFRFAELLFREWSFRLTDQCDVQFVANDKPITTVLPVLFSLNATEFNLDLRAQRRTFEMALAAGSAMDGFRKIHPLFLFFLCAVYVRRRQSWKAFWDEKMSTQEFSVWYSANVRNATVSTSIFGGRLRSVTNQHTLQLYTMMHEYKKIAAMSPRQITERINATQPSQSWEYPNVLFSNVVSGALSNSGRANICEYKQLIELAGQIE